MVNNEIFKVLTSCLLMTFVLLLVGCNGCSSKKDVTCPMCGGTGVFDFMPGDAFAPKQQCSACKGSGMVDEETAEELSEGIQKVNRMFGGNGNNSGYSNSNNNSQPVDNRCRGCYGSGKCSACAGRGEVRYDGMYGQPGGIMDCPSCKGTGRCQVCYGRGY